MREKIEVENDRVKLMRLTAKGEWITERELSLHSFLKFLAAELPPPWDEHPLLPPDCRWYGRKQRSEVLIVEKPPATRRIRFAARTRKSGDEAPEQFFDLAFPYVVFAFFFLERTFEEMKIYYRPAPLSSIKDPLYLCNLFNVQLSRGHRAHDRACLRPKPDVRELPLYEQVERLVSHFWNSEFNLDIEDSGFAFYAARHPRLASLEEWEKASRSDPLFVLGFPWETADVSLLQLIDSLINMRSGGHLSAYSTQKLGDICYALTESQMRLPRFDHREGVWRQ
jgi:hypothetical protein